MARYMVMGRHLQREKRDTGGPVINYGRWEVKFTPTKKGGGGETSLAMLKRGGGGYKKCLR